MDKRKHYILVLDTETANTLVNEKGGLDMSNVLVYDCGWAVVDTHGQVYETASFVNRDIFCDERDLMRTAYYARKIPQYIEDLRAGRRVMANTYEIRAAMLDTIERWGIREVAAYNARFDQNALNVTQRFCTASKWRYWFPFDKVEIWDIMKMAQDTICGQVAYVKWCEENDMLTEQGRPRKTAEMVYRFITGKLDFEESHTGLEDVLIEAAIMAHCFRQHKPMRKALWEHPIERQPQTDFQRQLMASIKKQPTLWAGR